MTHTFYVLLVISLSANSTYTIDAKRYETIDECLNAATSIDVMTKSFTKCVKKEERID
jgi:hypothetical protein